MNLKDFSLLKEDNTHYTIGHPKGKSMQIPKTGLSDQAQKLISQLKSHSSFAEGTPESEVGEETLPPTQETAEPEVEGETPETATPVASAELQSQAPPMTGVPQIQPGLQTAKESIQAGVSAQKQAGEEQAQAQEDYVNAASDLKSPDDIFQEHQTRQKELENQLVTQKLDPDRYLHNMGTGSKIATSIGLLLGGIGAGFSGGRNLPLDHLNQAINNDIEAQKNDQSNTMNLYKMNREMMGDESQAQLATQNQLLGIAKAKIMKAQAGALGPIAQQNAAQGILSIDHQIAQNNWMNSRLSSNAAPGTEQQHVSEMQVMQQLNPNFYKDMEAKYLPGVGIARVPVRPEDRQAFNFYNNLENQTNRAIEFAKTQGTVLNPFGASSQEAGDIQHQLQLEVGNLLGLKRINEYEAKKYEDLIKNPGQWSTQKAIQSFQDFKRAVNEKKNSEMVSLGITPFKKAASDQQALVWARSNPNDPRAAQILQMNGAK